MDNNLYYNPRKLLSHNKMLNFVMSHRGGGKTYAGKKLAIKSFLKDGSQWIYLRRFKTELKGDNVAKWFDDIRDEFPGHKLEVKGNTFYINGKQAGFAVALTQQVQIRSTPYPNVRLIIFDEFVLDERKTLKYLKDEVTTFLEIISTVVRSRDDVRVYCCANSISYINPYFDYWRIRVNPQDKKNFYFSPHNDQVVVELYSNKEFTDKMNQTRFGRLIANTDYGNYAVLNEVLLDSDEFLMFKKPKDSEFVCSFKYDDKVIGCWFSHTEQIYHFNNQIDPYNKLKISVTTDDHCYNYNTLKSLKSEGYFKSILDYYSVGMCFYKDGETKRAMFDILKIMGA